ncbi:MAG: hypothetical protein FWG18_03375, partial [Alphaproteobacteria bacterium]|nr:hypothetical protein [Alphaproteobacteria bacterium]
SDIKYLYGRNVGPKLLQNYEKLADVIRVEDGKTNVAASIVPTTRNYQECFQIIDYCMKRGIFPLIGQLEDAGKGTGVFGELEVKDHDLLTLKNYIKEKHHIEYEIPTCPATMSGIHINTENKVIVDKKTGLSCSWFWRTDPEMTELADITKDSPKKIVANINKYRDERIPFVEKLARETQNAPFGGCGGNVKTLLNNYLDIWKSK